MKQTEIRYTDNWREKLGKVLGGITRDKVFMLTDRNVERHVLAGMPEEGKLRFDAKIVIEPGESFKNLETCAEVWRFLAKEGATRHSILVNVGGGVVTDLGGFAAATFKRGIRFINVPTTLLAMADAAIGGKTGIDFMGYKNEIGVFAPALAVIIDRGTLKTLPESELRSGFAEVVKMAIISSNDEVYKMLLLPDALHDEQIMAKATEYAAEAKKRIVESDPYEMGVRKMLNFGHTAGHAYEEYAARIGKPISHGEAVAHGMLRALELSRDRKGYPGRKVEDYREKILERYYSPLPFDKEAPEVLAELELLMGHDKKNERAGDIGWVLL